MYRNLPIILLLTSLALWNESELATATSVSSNNDTGSELHDLAVLIHNRIVGMPAQGETLDRMIDLLAAGKAQEAALLATEHPFFYDFKLRALFTPWSNREGSVNNPLNDMVATMIGMVRDDVPFNEVLSGDFVYDRAEEHEPPHPQLPSSVPHPNLPEGLPTRPPSPQRSNYTNDAEHQKAVDEYLASPAYMDYQKKHKEYTQSPAYLKYLEEVTAEREHRDAWRANDKWHTAYKERYKTSGYSLADPDTSYKHYLKQFKQSQHSRQDKQGAVSGVLSTNTFARAFYGAGTNRRATAFVLKNFLCHEMEQLHDTSTPKNWVRQDVNRSPNGDPDIFNNRCVGCHAGMDALSGWTVYYDFYENAQEFNQQLTYTEGTVREKIGRNFFSDDGRVYGRGYKTKTDRFGDEEQVFIPGPPEHANDSFKNLWTEGKNAALGWRGKASGRGAKEFGAMITRSKAFSSCMARHVYKAVCYLDPEKGNAKKKSEQLAEQFETDNYNMRKLFANTATACLTKKQEKQNASSGG